MTEKLKVDKTLAEAIKYLLEVHGGRVNWILERHVLIKTGNHPTKWQGEKWDYLNALSAAELAQAIYVGYEIEETMEEKLVKLFKKTGNQHEWSEFDVRLLIAEALEITGLEVPNDYWKDEL